MVSAVLVIAIISAEAQQQALADKPAPVPTQILTAKKVFISNAGAEWDARIWTGDSARTYNEFYAAIQEWGRYELVSAPGDADLILQISFAQPLGDVNVFGPSGGSTIGSSAKDPQFRLVLLDPKTHVVLWAFTEHLQPGAGLKKARDRVFDETLSAVVNDLKILTTPRAAKP
jgi:hypothetical protein